VKFQAVWDVASRSFLKESSTVRLQADLLGTLERGHLTVDLLIVATIDPDQRLIRPCSARAER
jgi:hypothetical protein